MKANKINAAALANTAREVIAMCDNKKYTVAKIIAHWNLCVEQAGMTGTFDCPTCYKRKASIVGDMQRIALQLDRIADDRDPLTGESIHAADPRCDDEGNDPREWCGNDIEAAHAEALEIDKEIEEIVSYAGDRAPIRMGGDVNWIFNAALNVWRRLQAQLTQDAWINSDEIGRAIEMEHAHAEALDIDYCVEAVKEGGGYLGGYVVQNKDASFRVLRERTATGNPLKATYFSEDDYQQGRMKQFCFNGEIPVRLGAAVLAVAELAK